MVLKTEVVRVRLTEQEKVLLQERAEKLNMSMSDYIKYCCLINPPIKEARKRLNKATRGRNEIPDGYEDGAGS